MSRVRTRPRKPTTAFLKEDYVFVEMIEVEQRRGHDLLALERVEQRRLELYAKLDASLDDPVEAKKTLSAYNRCLKELDILKKRVFS